MTDTYRVIGRMKGYCDCDDCKGRHTRDIDEVFGASSVQEALECADPDIGNIDEDELVGELYFWQCDGEFFLVRPAGEDEFIRSRCLADELFQVPVVNVPLEKRLRWLPLEAVACP